MSKKLRNIIRDANMRNFSNYTIDRYMIIDDDWRDYKGDYLLLRINKEPNTNSEKNKIINYFGLTEFNVGDTKIVTINEYFNPFIRKLINELVISAYKIVV